MGIFMRLESKLDRLLEGQERLLAGQEALKAMVAELGDRPAVDGLQAGLTAILSYTPDRGTKTGDRGDKG